MYAMIIYLMLSGLAIFGLMALVSCFTERRKRK